MHERTDGIDGWVSLEVSPLLAYDTQRTVAAAKALYARADRRNLFIKIPGTPEGLPAIEEVIASGVPVNVTSGASSSARCLLSRSSRSSSVTEPELGHNSSTNALIRHYRTLKD
ncbi:transaldolase family protein [Streptomyces sp. NPDC055134]